MVRTQIQLAERQTQRLKALAKERGVSMAELIRQSIDIPILLETFALVQRRFGLTTLRALQQIAVPYLQTYWVDASTHAMGVAALLAANRRQLSLVDCTSFQAMRQLGIDTVFAFDEHFAEQQFICIP